jgi:hypothetical protein
VGESGKGGGGLETACLEGTRQTGEEAEVRKRQRGAATETPEPRPGGDGMQTGQRQQSSRDGNQQHEPAVTRKSSNELHEQLRHGTGPRMPGGSQEPVSSSEYSAVPAPQQSSRALSQHGSRRRDALRDGFQSGVGAGLSISRRGCLSRCREE